jgi:hypothetical protein
MEQRYAVTVFLQRNDGTEVFKRPIPPHPRMCVYTYIQIHVHVYACIRVYMHFCTSIQRHFTCIFVCRIRSHGHYICVNAGEPACMYPLSLVFKYTHTHKQKHAHARTHTGT